MAARGDCQYGTGWCVSGVQGSVEAVLITFSNIGGATIHSWAGIGLGKWDVDKLVGSIQKNGITRARWLSTGALIIDESKCPH